MSIAIRIPKLRRLKEEVPIKKKTLKERFEEHGIFLEKKIKTDNEELTHRVLDELEKRDKKLGSILGHFRVKPEDLIASAEKLLSFLVEKEVLKAYEIPRDHEAVKSFLERFDNGEDIVRKIEHHLNVKAFKRGYTGEIHLDIGHILNQVYTRGGKVSEKELEKLVEEALSVVKKETTVKEALKELGIHKKVMPHLKEDHLNMKAYVFYRKGKKVIVPAEIANIVEKAKKGSITKEEAWRILEAITRDHNLSVIKLSPKV